MSKKKITKSVRMSEDDLKQVDKFIAHMREFYKQDMTQSTAIRVLAMIGADQAMRHYGNSKS